MIMEVRITFRSEVYIEGDTLQDIKEKWESMPLFSEDALNNANAEFLEEVSVEDAKNYKDLMDKWDELE